MVAEIGKIPILTNSNKPYLGIGGTREQRSRVLSQLREIDKRDNQIHIHKFSLAGGGGIDAYNVPKGKVLYINSVWMSSKSAAAGVVGGGNCNCSALFGTTTYVLLSDNLHIIPGQETSSNTTISFPNAVYVPTEAVIRFDFPLNVNLDYGIGFSGWLEDVKSY